MAGRKNRGLLLAIYAVAKRKGVSPFKVVDEVIDTHPVYLKPPPKVRSQPRSRIVNGQYYPLHWCLPRSARPRCGAQTREGSPCKRLALRNGRCCNHGGKSTGPKTEAGKARIAEGQRRRWVAYHAAKGAVNQFSAAGHAADGRERASPATALEFLKRYKKGGALRLVFIVRGRTPIADVTLRKQHRGGPGSLVSLPPNAALRFAASTVHAVALRRERRTGAISTVFERPSSSANSACSRKSCGKVMIRWRPLCRGLKRQHSRHNGIKAVPLQTKRYTKNETTRREKYRKKRKFLCLRQRSDQIKR